MHPDKNKNVEAIKRAGEAIQKWHDEKLGFIASEYSFEQLMWELRES